MQFRQSLRKTQLQYLHQKAELNQLSLALSFDDVISKLSIVFV